MELKIVKKLKRMFVDPTNSVKLIKCFLYYHMALRFVETLCSTVCKLVNFKLLLRETDLVFHIV